MIWQKLYIGDTTQCLEQIEPNSIDCVMTSPPYWGLRDYGITGQIGLEPHPQEFIDKLVNIFDSIAKKLLKKTGTMWINLGDTYFGSGGASGDYEK